MYARLTYTPGRIFTLNDWSDSIYFSTGIMTVKLKKNDASKRIIQTRIKTYSSLP